MFGISFFMNNYIAIIILSISIIGLLVIFSMFNNKLTNTNDRSYKNIGKVVTIETLENSTDDLPNKSMSKTACETYKHNHPLREDFCKNLASNECNASSCCIRLNNNDCVAGDKQGPIYLTSEPNSKTPIVIEYYHYKNNCYKGQGNCP